MNLEILLAEFNRGIDKGQFHDPNDPNTQSLIRVARQWAENIQPADAYTHEERLLINEACHRLGVGPPFPIREPSAIVEEFVREFRDALQ